MFLMQDVTKGTFIKVKVNYVITENKIFKMYFL